ncbi:MAG: DUF3418 domain-containing protein, partial [Verrucomicrobiota bacterium]
RRVQEWINLHRELRESIQGLKWDLPPKSKRLSDPEDTYSEPLHRAILSAIPSQIGMHQGKKKGYQGARNSTFFLFPGSGIFGSAPAWAMAFEMVETAKLYARNAAVFDPGWFEKVAPHLCRYRYSNPQWNKEQGAVYGEERVIAFGLPVVEKRKIHYGRIDRAVARSVFLLEALVNQNTRAPIPVLARNRETLLAAEKLEHKMRRLGGLMHPEAVVSFYEEKIPPDICTQKDFEKWNVQQKSGFLDFKLEDCLLPQQEPIRVEDYPDKITSPDGEAVFELSYLHNPSEEGDGISATIPLVELSHLPAWFGEWVVPGWLPEKVSALFRCLPKETRTMLPANREVVAAFLESWEGYEPACGLLEAILDFLESGYGITLSSASFDLDRLPPHFRMRFLVVDDEGREVGQGRSLAELQSSLRGRVRKRFETVSRGKFEQEGIGSWSFGDLPEEVELDRHTVGYPRLFDEGKEFPSMRLWSSHSCAEFQHWLGVAQLYEVTRKERVARLQDEMFRSSPQAVVRVTKKPKQKKASSGPGFGSLADAFGVAGEEKKTVTPRKVAAPAAKSSGNLTFLTADEAWLLSQIGPDPGRNRRDLLRRIVGAEIGGPLRKEDWKRRADALDGILFEKASEVCGRVSRCLEIANRVGGLLENTESGYEESLEDAREHFSRLLASGWLLQSDLSRLLVHFQGLEMRLTRMLGAPPIKDLQKLERYWEGSSEIWKEEPVGEWTQCPTAIASRDALEKDYDLRLQLFAPEIKARMK